MAGYSPANTIGLILINPGNGVAAGRVTYNQCRGIVGNPVPAGGYCNDDVANIFGNTTPQPTFTRTPTPRPSGEEATDVLPLDGAHK